jgi:hypothetical protein
MRHFPAMRSSESLMVSKAASVTADPPFKIQEWPAEQRERRKLTELKPNPKNPKKHPQAQVEALAASYKEFGVTGLILIDEENTIIAGEGRWLAAKHAGITEVPVAVARGWNKRKKMKYLFADNQLPLLGEFDDLLRQDVIKGLELSAQELAALGLNDASLAAIMAGQGLTDVSKEWEGMPEFTQEDHTAFRSILVHFKDQSCVDKFVTALKLKITPKTRFLWYPIEERLIVSDKRYVTKKKTK